jgi:hypothetical protein
MPYASERATENNNNINKITIMITLIIIIIKALYQLVVYTDPHILINTVLSLTGNQISRP